MTFYILLNDDCLERMKAFPDNSIDAIVTDPPAGIAFMGKEITLEQWIADVAQKQEDKER